jgi:putative NADH-flavin reductase
LRYQWSLLRVVSASSNFGTLITAILISAGSNVTVISRIHSTTTFSSGLSVIKIEYTRDKLIKALTSQDAAVCVVGPAGMVHQVTLIDAVEVADVKRFIIDDFG